MPSFIRQILLSLHHVIGTVLDTKETLVNTDIDGPYPYGVYNLMRTDRKEKKERRREGGRDTIRRNK